jgi:hypothetical protein
MQPLQSPLADRDDSIPAILPLMEAYQTPLVIDVFQGEVTAEFQLSAPGDELQ